VLFIVTPLNVM